MHHQHLGRSALRCWTPPQRQRSLWKSYHLTILTRNLLTPVARRNISRLFVGTSRCAFLPLTNRSRIQWNQAGATSSKRSRFGCFVPYQSAIVVFTGPDEPRWNTPYVSGERTLTVGVLYQEKPRNCFQTTFTPIWSVLKVQGTSALTCVLCSLSFAQKYSEARRLPAAAPEARWPAAGIWSPEARWSLGRWLAACDSLLMRQEIRRGCSAGLLSRCQRGI